MKRRLNRTTLALCLNALILLMILLAITARDGRLLGGSTAFGQAQPVAMGGLAVMPAQLSPNVWGCYVMDSQNQTLSVYKFSPGEPLLKLAAARDIKYDRMLGSFNTAPDPLEIKDLVEKAEERGRATTQP